MKGNIVSRLILESYRLITRLTKRIGYIITKENVTIEFCKEMILKASKQKRRRYDVKKVLNNMGEYAVKLQQMILQDTFTTSEYKKIDIIDKGSLKQRTLSIPKFFPDQCVHHALISLIEDKLTKRIDCHAIANIKGKGIHYGLRKINTWLRYDRKHTKYCLKCDIRKCYDNIKPEYVIQCFNRFIKDKLYLSLISKVVYSCSSLPLGNYTSAWIVNLFLLELDKLCSSNFHYYIRYVDDFVILSSNKRKLRNFLLKISLCLGEKELALKKNYQIFKVADRGIDMLGYRIYNTHTVLRKRNALNIIKIIRKWNKHKTPHRARVILSYNGALKWFNSYNFRKKYFSDLDRKELIAYANGNYRLPC